MRQQFYFSPHQFLGERFYASFVTRAVIRYVDSPARGVQSEVRQATRRYDKSASDLSEQHEI